MTPCEFFSLIKNGSSNLKHIYVVKKTDNVPSRLLPICQWPHGNSCTWTHAQVHELPWGHWQIGNKREGTLSLFLTLSLSLYTYI